MTADQVKSLLELWIETLSSGDSRQITALYADDAVLLPTLSNRVRTNPSEISDYFNHFTEKHPRGCIEESHLRIMPDAAACSGIYTFTFMDGSLCRARFTFVYEKIAGEWKITSHHSSRMPE